MIFISKTLIRSTHKLCFLELYPCSRFISTNQPSFKVSYLINSCGLSPESALKASKLVRGKFDSREKPDSVLAFFNIHGFSETRVSKIIRSAPQLITSNPAKTLLPKLQFFYSKGISVPDLAKMLSTNPNILKTSLENRLIPTFDFLTVYLQSEDKTIETIKRYPGILLYNFHRGVVPIIEILQNYGVPESNIMKLLTNQPRGFMSSSEKFTEIIENVKKMGFDPSKTSFVTAIHALKAMSKPTWETKVEIYKRWGWSDEEILHAFRKHPWCMTYSEETISAKMDFFINKMGWDPSIVARNSQFVSFSLEKRIIPRCSVLLELLSKGLIEKNLAPTAWLMPIEKIFLQKYVNCYKDEASHLLKIYHKIYVKEKEPMGPY